MILAVSFGARTAGLKGLRERSPQAVFATIVLLEAGAEISWLRLVEIVIGFVSVAIASFGISRQETHGNKRVEEVAGSALVHLDVAGEGRGIQRPGCEHREN